MERIDQFASIARALYGERWQRPAARAVGTHPVQIRRWQRYEYELPPVYLSKIQELAGERIKELRGLLCQS